MSELTHLETQPAEVEFKLANAWRRKGKSSRAIAGYRKAISLQPEYIPAYMELADMLKGSGMLDEAIAVYRQAVESNPRDPGLQNKLSSLVHRKERLADTPTQTAGPQQASEFPSTTQRGHILFYSDRPGINGAEQINHLLMCGLAADYQVTCVQSQDSHHLIRERERRGLRHVWIAWDDLYDIQNSPRALNDLSEPREIFTRTKPDLVIFGDGCPFSSLTAKQVAVELRIPYIALVHCVTAPWAEYFAPYAEKLAAVYAHAREVIAVSRENLALLHQWFGLPQNTGRVIYNGRPTAYFATPNPATRQRLRSQLDIPVEATVCLTLARVDWVKGYQHQIEAIKQLQHANVWPQLYFVWVGAGGSESRIRAMAMGVNAGEHVKFLGERSDVAELLDVADMFILPSHFEGMPLSIMEAMAKGLPVMATAVSGIPEELGTTGQLLPDPEINAAATVEAMTTTILSWARDEQLRRRVGCECKRRAEEEFRSERMLEEYLHIVAPLMASQPTNSVYE